MEAGDTQSLKLKWRDPGSKPNGFVTIHNVLFFVIPGKLPSQQNPQEKFPNSKHTHFSTLTSKSTESCFFVIFTYVGLEVPSHCGSQMGRRSHWSFPVYIEKVINMATIIHEYCVYMYISFLDSQHTILGAAVAEWLCSWLAEQEVQGSIPSWPLEFQRLVMSSFQVAIWLKYR